jgi:hypothetical protein
MHLSNDDTRYVPRSFTISSIFDTWFLPFSSRSSLNQTIGTSSPRISRTTEARRQPPSARLSTVGHNSGETSWTPV